jgi:3-oxoacyl-[acyl-carrier-protein] synthase II
MSSPRRVALTGIGVISPLGLDADSFAAALQAGRCAIRPLRSFDTAGLPVRIGAEIDGFDARNYLEKKDRKQLKMMVRTIQLAVAGARLAMDDSRLEAGRFDPARFGVSFGIGTIPGELIDVAAASQASRDSSTGLIDVQRWGRDGMPTIQPMWMLNHVPNMAACHVSILHNAQGPNNTITQSDASGLLALGEAFRILQRDSADVMLAGGADTRTNPISLIRYSLFGRLSRCAEAEQACKPFDRRRSGQVLGEGAGILVVEDLDHARRRGARIHAEVLGFGASFDRGRTGRGLARAVRAALHEAGITPGDLDHVNAHAAGTLDEDPWEARGLAEALEGAPVPVLAVKSYQGNTGTGASILELAASLLALRDGIMPPTLHHDQTDPSCPVLVAREPRTVTKPCVLKVACTERGQCAAAVLRRGEIA